VNESVLELLPVDQREISDVRNTGLDRPVQVGHFLIELGEGDGLDLLAALGERVFDGLLDAAVSGAQAEAPELVA